ncbi:unnamed protein product [Phytophthora fragariaefolia]|uniref:Unnamed protein product n=1 Tax=Phytophthora fragariaefolia TaxID=1490495 RepID=A0A9W6XJE8_9STRA|nr:unnamed protein product [Phytophthora fragariaefolia]
MNDNRSRTLQHVVAVADRERYVKWMEWDQLENGEKGLARRAVEQFPSLFRAADRRVNLNKARDWWRNRSSLQLALEDQGQQKYARMAQGGSHQLVHKTLAGEGRKSDLHWEWLYPQLLGEFEHLRHAGVKLSSRLLMDMAITMIEDSQHPVYNTAVAFKGKFFSL